jgi:hypothetical protein
MRYATTGKLDPPHVTAQSFEAGIVSRDLQESGRLTRESCVFRRGACGSRLQIGRDAHEAVHAREEGIAHAAFARWMGYERCGATDQVADSARAALLELLGLTERILARSHLHIVMLAPVYALPVRQAGIAQQRPRDKGVAQRDPATS